ncbi:hypothetical protein IC582_027076 [Cucumis melo]
MPYSYNPNYQHQQCKQIPHEPQICFHGIAKPEMTAQLIFLFVISPRWLVLILSSIGLIQPCDYILFPSFYPVKHQSSVL